MAFNYENIDFSTTESSEMRPNMEAVKDYVTTEFNPEQAKAEVDQEKMDIVCSETQKAFPDSIICFENATHLLYQEITGKKRARIPDPDGIIRDEFRLPKSEARPLSKNMPEGYALDDSELAKRMLAENDLLIATPNKSQIYMFGDLIDEPVEGEDFKTIESKNGQKIKVETLGRNIEHVIFHKVYEHDILRIASNKEQPEEIKAKTSEEAKMLLEMISVAPEKVNIDQNSEFSNYQAILELMAMSGDLNFTPTTSEEERTEAIKKIEEHFQASQELKKRKAALLDLLRDYYDDFSGNFDEDLRFVISGYEKEFNDAKKQSTDSSDFLRNFMMSAPNIEDMVSERLKNLPNSDTIIVGDSILRLTDKNN